MSSVRLWRRNYDTAEAGASGALDDGWSGQRPRRLNFGEHRNLGATKGVGDLRFFEA